MQQLYKLNLRDFIAGARENRWTAVDGTRACLERAEALERAGMAN